MKVLLDTHAWLWLMLEPSRIGSETRALCTSADNSFYLSVASVWELAIKHAAGKLALPQAPLTYVRTRTRDDGIALCSISVEHVCRASELPRHHGDPFDRLLVAQAEVEGFVVLTHDQQIPKYGVRTIDPAL